MYKFQRIKKKILDLGTPILNMNSEERKPQKKKKKKKTKALFCSLHFGDTVNFVLKFLQLSILSLLFSIYNQFGPYH